MTWWEALLLGVVEGITEFLPISSTGHLTMAEFFLGKDIADVGVVAFTAVIQIGAILAAVVYFWSDIWRIAKAWLSGLVSKEKRLTLDYHFGWAIILGSIPIAVVGLALKDFIETGLRSMWFVAGGLVLWSVVLFGADRFSAKSHVGMSRDSATTIPQAFIIGLVQCFSLIPGVSRSGATISAGLFLGFDRVKATRLSFFLGIPALVAAGALEGISNFGTIGKTVGWGSTAIGMIVSFVVGYLSIAWLLKFVSKHSFNAFIIYRLVVGGLIACCLLAGIIPAV
ncbi:undecaprenyl-diphosphate phosphatase [Mobiluncus mulieris]|uniref:undecaprenyl-diphosphate phosphatase n=1 Tax=Mobiluncus mulieris TaxID=2052 RepID=UPI002430A690|nr:undecaprenyl-diphosphate phosphatase [Mobiluncus mulieris]